MLIIGVNMEKILIIEDKDNELENLCNFITFSGFNSIPANNGRIGLELYHTEAPDLILLDYKMPGMNGLEVLKKIRAVDLITPIFIITGYATEKLEREFIIENADYIITKPYSCELLLVMIKNFIKKVKVLLNKHSLNFGNLTFDFAKRGVLINDNFVNLTVLEFNLLSFLLNKRGEFIEKRVLIKNVWNDDSLYVDAENLRTKISDLRKKIGDNNREPRFIQTKQGFGYGFFENFEI
jgi:two-component system, OmpR family, alkaline phosphatase synthesis response regulator PhoP